jgi:hypothetical protein
VKLTISTLLGSRERGALLAFRARLPASAFFHSRIEAICVTKLANIFAVVHVHGKNCAACSDVAAVVFSNVLE